MKKFFSFTLISLFFAATTAFAQSEQKEYNMVITLQNGTTVTLGHNDIRDITFNNGEISISGNVVETIAKIASTADSLANISRDSQYQLEKALAYMDNMNEEAQNNIAYLEAAMDETRTQIKVTSDMLLSKVGTLEAAMENSQNNMATIQTVVEDAQARIKETEYRIQETEYRIKDLEVVIMELMNRIKMLESQLAQ
ncbi:MAG: hypothetical protein PUB53_02720 [Bacteroidales bacterium]|nr:hypothetical protein [Bacteroidales bacterium]